MSAFLTMEAAHRYATMASRATGARYRVTLQRVRLAGGLHRWWVVSRA